MWVKSDAREGSSRGRFAPALVLVIGVLGCRASGDAVRGPVQIRVLAEDRGWSASYLPDGPDASAELPTGREVHVPVGAEVSLTLASRDYVALFAMPGLGLRDFAAPGVPGTFRFHPEQPGAYELRGDELCGLPHGEEARGKVIVEGASAYRAWLSSRTASR